MIRTLYTLILILGFTNAIAVPSNLRCEHMVNPIGIDAHQPRFTWIMTDTSQGAFQTAYQVLVGSDSNSIAMGVSLIWNTGKINSSKSLVIFKGKLQPFTKYFWRVETWDHRGKKTTSSMATFETGMMDVANWKGAWISDSRDIHLKPAPYFRKQFSLQKRIVSARAYIAAAGLYELYVNGERIGNHRLDPMYTRFDRRILYVTHDITNNVKQGDNGIGVLLGNGWYNHQSTAVWYFHQAPWRARPSFCMDVRIKFDDGTVQTISSGRDWKTNLSPVIFNSIYTAEHYDARLEQPGWNAAPFDDSKWKQVELRPAPTTNIVSQVLHPIRYVEKILPKSMSKKSDTTYVYDLGRNISGVTEISLSGEAGTIVKLKHAERLDSAGFVDMSNIDVHYRPTDGSDPFQTDIFILGGKGREAFSPKFNYKGFQYVQVISDRPITLDNNSLVGYFMHSDVPPIGKIESSNPVIDKIWFATNNAYLSNLFGYPTDCPQREKNGWTGDAHIASETGLFGFDGITVYEKWMADHRDEQQPNGVLPAIIPTSGWGYHWANGPDWTSTIAIIPWNIYLFYGDDQLLRDCYTNMKRYVDYINDLDPSGITSWGLGDWVPVKSKSPVDLTSSIYYFIDATILAKAARLFAKADDERKYSALAARIKNAINAKYLDREKGIYGKGLQTELCAPLFWGIVPEELKQKVADNLARAVAANNYSLDVGILGAKAILNALSENGHAEVAYKLASREEYPSWGWWIKNGATTLYENWNINSKYDISLNHIMFGEIGAWLYKALGGIKPDSLQPGFKNILLSPNFVEGLDHFTASFNGPYGKIISAWKKSQNGLTYSVEIPANSTATVSIPVNEKQTINLNGKPISAGSYRIDEKKERRMVINLKSGKYEFIRK